MASEHEDRITRFHARHPGITSRGLARSGSYEQLADRVATGARVLDVGCGDGHLLDLLARRCPAIGVDVSACELALARQRGVACIRARAQDLPFHDHSFDVVVSHMAFMLLDEIERVVGELSRVLVPGGHFMAVLGGGPVAHPEPGDAFARFLQLVAPRVERASGFGDRRAKSQIGWQALFAAWRAITFERIELDLAGRFDEVWDFLAGSYELAEVDADAIRTELQAISGQSRVACRAVIWVATATL